MKLTDAIKAIKKSKQQTVQPVVEVANAPTLRSRPSGTLNHHRGVIHLMGLEQGSTEYEEMSRDLDDLSKTNPTLYHRIVSLD